MTKSDNMPEDFLGAFERMQLINRQLEEDSTDPESQASLMDELLNLDMGLGPFRRSITKEAFNVDEKFPTQGNPKSERD